MILLGMNPGLEKDVPTRSRQSPRMCAKTARRGNGALQLCRTKRLGRIKDDYETEGALSEWISNRKQASNKILLDG